MTTIVINIQDKAKAKHILSAVKLLNGVTRAEIATPMSISKIFRYLKPARQRGRLQK